MKALRWWQIWMISFVFWTVYAVLDSTGSFSILAMAQQTPARTRVLAWNFSEAWVWVLVTPLIWAITQRYSFTAGRWKKSLFVHLATGWLVTSLCCGLLILMNTLAGWADTQTPLYLRLFDFTLADLPRYFMTAAIVQIGLYYAALRSRELDLARLEAAFAQAQLQILRAQLDPHFLFNTLNSIAALSRRQPRDAERMTLQLAALLRVSLETAAPQQIPLGEELEFLRNYVAIQETRFRDRLSVHLEVDPTLLAAPVPSLLLQPLVENAIRHGVARSAAPGRVLVVASRDRQRMKIEVLDNGAGLQAAAAGGGFGLSNTRARLHRLYGEDHGFELADAEGGGCRVTLMLPLGDARRTGPP